jgi:3-methylcrotonyl-CoA carboxylase alpha subunit
MGSKIAARELMRQAGVPVVAGRTPADQSDEGIAAAAKTIGFPALVKASSGGGGKGMRTVRDPRELADAIPAARREAIAAFGDGTLYVERLIERPRHIEVQIFADNHGHTVHLFERECSVQRRHQKVIEESPSPAVTPELRERMGAVAVAAARAAEYRNAGTIEFLVHGSGEFYFLEMNTRLQVEHPVTEAVTGTDLVRAQIDVASGAPLPWTESPPSPRGHAIECRVYAEDPEHGFLPQAGPLLIYREPAGPGIRIDSGVEEGGAISVHYDPLLAKLVASAGTRSAAIARARTALRSFPVLGVRTNIPFLLRLLEHPAFEAGDLHTGFVDEHAETLLREPAPDTVAIAAATVETATPASAPASGAPVTDPWATLEDWGR